MLPICDIKTRVINTFTGILSHNDIIKLAMVVPQCASIKGLVSRIMKDEDINNVFMGALSLTKLIVSMKRKWFGKYGYKLIFYRINIRNL